MFGVDRKERQQRQPTSDAEDRWGGSGAPPEPQVVAWAAGVERGRGCRRGRSGVGGGVGMTIRVQV
jgi:hypothetical protein